MTAVKGFSPLTAIALMSDVVDVDRFSSAEVYEQLGGPGIEAFSSAARRAREPGLLVIADGKRNDIGSTCLAYARAFLGRTDSLEARRPFSTWTP